MKQSLTIVLASLLIAGCVSKECEFGGMDAVTANGNNIAAVKAEVESDEFVALLARRAGMSEWRVRMLSPVVELSDHWGISYSPSTNSDLLETTKRYITMRKAGHTRQYAMARLDGEPDERTIPADCRAILKEDKEAYFPRLWLYDFKMEGDANHTTYVILDGELAWVYMVSRKNDRSLIGCHFDWFDAKEFLPEYRKAFSEVNKQVEKEMRSKGTWDYLGSCHIFWSRKQELLKQRGIEWRSPPDLHPNTCYD